MVVNINGYNWNVEFVDKDHEKLGGKNDGITIYNDMAIYVRDDLSPVMKKEVVIHELTHATLCVQGRWGQRKFDVEEVCEFMGFCANTIVELANWLVG